MRFSLWYIPNDHFNSRILSLYLVPFQLLSIPILTGFPLSCGPHGF